MPADRLKGEVALPAAKIVRPVMNDDHQPGSPTFEGGAAYEAYLDAKFVMVTCEVCGGDGHFDQVVGHDPSGPVYSDSFCTACQGAGEYAVKREPITINDLDEM